MNNLGLATTANRIIAIGHNAAASETTGSRNIYVGFGAGALTSGTNSVNNVVIGDQAGGVGLLRNVFLGGLSAARFFTDVSASTVLGFSAAQGTQGSSTALWESLVAGYQACVNCQYLVRSVLLGHTTGSSLISGSDVILIGRGVNVPNSTMSLYMNIGNAIYGNLAGAGTASVGGTTKIGINVASQRTPKHLSARPTRTNTTAEQMRGCATPSTSPCPLR